MINASFSSTGRDATISGAYQYDTGQRLKMYGLPSPSELAERDDFLSGDVVTVQAQFGFTGDSQTESSIAEWVEDEEGNGYWLAKVPDVYMLKNQDVHVYVYVSYGQTETSMRSKTVYEAVFRPISRPAPQTGVTPDQTNAWDRLVAEINLKLTEVGTAISGANAAKEEARAAANAANDAAEESEQRVNEYLSFLGRTDVAVERIEDPYAEPSVDVTDETDEDGNEYKLVTFSLPQSVVTVNGQAADGNGNITLTPEHVGAMPATHQTVFEFTTTIPANMNGSEGVAVNVAGVLAADRPVVDIDMAVVEAEDREVTLEAWANILRINAGDGVIGIIYAGETSVAIPIRLLCVR